jgi:hypothetical protein
MSFRREGEFMMRWIVVIAAAAALVCAAQSEAGVPPPPPGPPADLPAAYDGYPTEALWFAYIYWVREQTSVRREAAFDALRLPGWSDDPAAWRTGLQGPHYVSTSYWVPAGLHFSFEQVCPVSSGYGQRPKGCLWRYRSAFFRAQEGDVHAIVHDTFDGEAFARHLAAQGIGLDAVSRDFRSAFGLEELVRNRLDALIVTRNLREDSCPAVGEAIEDLASMTLSLSPYGPPAGTPPPPPPLPPGADHEVLVIPAGFYPDTDVRVTFEGQGTGTMQVLVSTLVAPLHACFSDAAE